MNWTGGRLQQHSAKPRTSLTSVQKQHFAKVQNSLSSGKRKRSPLRMVIGNGLHGRQASPSGQLSRTPHVRDYEDHFCHSNLQKAHSIERSAAEPHKLGSTQTDHVYDGVCADEPYDATPKPREATVKREMPIVPEKVGVDYWSRESGAEKRRRLLQKGDWVGISIQKPMHLRFSSPENNDDVGRRKKMSNGYQARYESNRVGLSSPIRRGNNDQNRRCFPGQESRMAPPARNDVHISIGGRAIPPKASSSSRLHKILPEHTPQQYMLRRSMTQSSDVMLLDNDDARLGSQPSVSHPEASQGHESVSTSTNLRGYGVAQVYAAPKSSAHGIIHMDGHIPLIGSSEHDIHSLSILDPGESPKLRGSRSSSLHLHHPVPQRLSNLISSIPSDDACSITAQVGRAKVHVTSSQALENEVWKGWIASMDSSQIQDQSHPYGEDSADAYHRSLIYSVGDHDDSMAAGLDGPGISMISSPRDIPRSSTHRTELSERTADTIEEQVADHPGGIIGVMHSSMEFKRLDTLMTKAQSTSLQIDEVSSPKLRKTVVPSTAMVRKQKSASDEAEEIWRKFVFGEDEDASDAEGSEAGLNIGDKYKTSTNASSKGPDHPGKQCSSVKGKVTVQPIVSNILHMNMASNDRYGPSNRSTAAVRGSTASSSSPNPKDYAPSSRAFSAPDVSTPGASDDGSAYRVFALSNQSSTTGSLSSPIITAVSTTASESAGTPTRAGRKVVFTRPHRFQGSKSHMLEAPLHIGPKFNMQHGERRERGMYGMLGTEDLEDDQGSIEDD